MESLHLTSHEKVELSLLLSQASGGSGMIGGQVLDMEYTAKEVPLDTLKITYEKKTGELLTSAILFGAILAKATSSQISILKQFGKALGLSFQIVDDILDVTQAEQKHGTHLGSDTKNGKETYVSKLGLEKAKSEAQHYLSLALNLLKKLPLQQEILTSLTKHLIARKI